jgi:hypothetical protein
VSREERLHAVSTLQLVLKRLDHSGAYANAC